MVSFSRDLPAADGDRAAEQAAEPGADQPGPGVQGVPEEGGGGQEEVRGDTGAGLRRPPQPRARHAGPRRRHAGTIYQAFFLYALHTIYVSRISGKLSFCLFGTEFSENLRFLGEKISEIVFFEQFLVKIFINSLFWN